MRILLVSSRFPLPPWRGNQLRTLQWLEALDGHQRLLFCPAEAADELPAELGTEFVSTPPSPSGALIGLVGALLRGRPAQEGIYASGAARRRLTGVLDSWLPDVAVIQMVRCGWAADVIAAVQPETPVVFDAIDSMALHYRRAATLGPPLVRLAQRFEAARCRRRESELVRRAVVSTAVSSRDLRELGAGSRGMVVTVAGGVEAERGETSRTEPTVLLSGNLGYLPTVRAAIRFADRIWPQVRAAVPSASWVLAGARPATAVRELASRPGVEVHGDVDDLGEFLSRATVAVAPMTSGSGVPVKILEAMAAGVPVVADAWSASGLEDPTAVTVADSDGEWVDELHRLLDDPDAADVQAAGGLEVWRSHYHPSRVKSQIVGAVSVAAQRVD